MSHYRDDLRAAQERVRVLEERVRELEARPGSPERAARRRESSRRASRRGPPATSWQDPNEPTGREVWVAIGGGLATALLSLYGVIYALAAIAPPTDALLGAASVYLVGTPFLSVSLPRAISPSTRLFIARRGDGTYDGGIRWPRARWLWMALAALALQAASLVFAWSCARGHERPDGGVDAPGSAP